MATSYPSISGVLMSSRTMSGRTNSMGTSLGVMHYELDGVLPKRILQPGTVVIHARHGLIAFDAGVQRDPAAEMGLLRGVIQQVREDLPEPRRIGEERDRFGG